jgi:hypothetical protein
MQVTLQVTRRQVTQRNIYIIRERLHSNKMDLTFYQDRPDFMVNRITKAINRPQIKHYQAQQMNIHFNDMITPIFGIEGISLQHYLRCYFDRIKKLRYQ